MKIAVLPGDGIGTEIVTEAVKVLKVLELPFEMETALVGGAAYEAHGVFRGLNGRYGQGRSPCPPGMAINKKRWLCDVRRHRQDG